MIINLYILDNCFKAIIFQINGSLAASTKGLKIARFKTGITVGFDKSTIFKGTLLILGLCLGQSVSQSSACVCMCVTKLMLCSDSFIYLFIMLLVYRR